MDGLRLVQGRGPPPQHYSSGTCCSESSREVNKKFDLFYTLAFSRYLAEGGAGGCRCDTGLYCSDRGVYYGESCETPSGALKQCNKSAGIHTQQTARNLAANGADPDISTIYTPISREVESVQHSYTSPAAVLLRRECRHLQPPPTRVRRHAPSPSTDLYYIACSFARRCVEQRAPDHDTGHKGLMPGVTRKRAASAPRGTRWLGRGAPGGGARAAATAACARSRAQRNFGAFPTIQYYCARADCLLLCHQCVGRGSRCEHHWRRKTSRIFPRSVTTRGRATMVQLDASSIVLVCHLAVVLVRSVRVRFV